MKIIRLFGFLCFLWICSAQSNGVPNNINEPSIPVPRPDSTGWTQRHAQFIENTANNPDIPIIFYGDSITERWHENGITVFERFYEPLNVANYGIGGDRTQWLQWRIRNGEVQGLSPKLVVLKIGTNNVARNVDSSAAKGIINVVGTLRELLPNTKILLLGLLPRTGADYFDRIVGINSRLRTLHDGQNIFYLDMFNQFRDNNAWGVVPATLFSDGVHLTTGGYELWAEIMNPVLNKLIQE
ncbi:platelet-activating factor acetylhydrolase IB subunit beta-like [Bradysia coprophila]|uniref:platelet-activating factor acetylhydrolase IB subunit beta-like n=1 Tax=Bradysia coprophila TaxID=38358 RepID=UPI00187DA65F|nr:platelet-activating factor acetylhydrolase IB subunit beta-like [Bradysia coprophila]